MAASKAVEKFGNKLIKIKETTGFEFDVSQEIIEEHIDANRLFAGWFAPNTLLATATNGQSTIRYEIAGGVEASLLSPTGETVHAFLGKFSPFDNGEIRVDNDKDIEALADGKHESGYTLLFVKDNQVKVSVEKLKEINPMYMSDHSVARNILNESVVMVLKAAIDALIKPEDRLPDGEINMKLDALAEAAAELEAEKLETLAKEAEAASQEPEEDAEIDLPEPIAEETKKEPRKAEKAPKKANKSAPKSKKKEEKTSPAPADEEAVGRFDLLPLDIIGKIVSEEFDTTGEKDVLGYIEDYKKSKDEEALINAAMYLIDGYFASPTDFVMALAVMVEKDAEEYGEDFWKEKDATRCINEAIKEWLMYLQESNEENKLMRAAWSLICAARVAKE